MRDDRKMIIRSADPSDRPRLLSLFHEVFGEARSDEEWRWKYEATPLGSISMVAELGGKLIAHCGGVHLPFAICGEQVQATVTVDVMTAPEAEVGLGRGILFKRLIESYFGACRAAGAAFTYGFPSDRHYVAGARTVGYEALGQIVEFSAPAVEESHQARPLSRRRIERFSEPRGGTLGWTRDRRSLEWRYLERPGAEYHLVEAGNLFRRSSAIVRIRPEGAYVMELAGATEGAVWMELVRRLRALGRDVRVWCPQNQAIGRALAAAGFESSLRPHPLAVRWLGLDAEGRSGRFVTGAVATDSFYYTFGDYDVY